MADLIASTARQVRLPGGTVHQLLGQPCTMPTGRQYRTRCGRTLFAYHGAMLTTRPAGCASCTTGTPADERTRALVEAVLAGAS